MIQFLICLPVSITWSLFSDAGPFCEEGIFLFLPRYKPQIAHPVAYSIKSHN
jgi:hypothetical protein